MTAEEFRVVDFGIDDEGVLELGIAALTSELREAGNALAVERAGDQRICRQVGNARKQAGQSEADGALAALSPREAETRRRCTEVGLNAVGKTRINLLIEDMNVAVGVANRQGPGMFGGLKISSTRWL